MTQKANKLPKLNFRASKKFETHQIVTFLPDMDGISVSHENEKFVYLHPFHAPDTPVPDHEEVESNEEPQHSSHICHQGKGGVVLLEPRSCC